MIFKAEYVNENVDNITTLISIFTTLNTLMIIYTFLSEIANRSTVRVDFGKKSLKNHQSIQCSEFAN